MIILNLEHTLAKVFFLDLVAKLDQTAEFKCGVKRVVARGSAALCILIAKSGSGKINIDILVKMGNLFI